MLITGDAARRRSSWATGSSIPHHYHFSVKFVFDRLSVPFAILSFVLSGTIGAFASRYMHRERGLQPLLRPLRDLRAGHGGDLAGRDDRDAVRRLGAGRAVVGAAGRVLPGAAGPGAERALGLGRLPRLRRRAPAGRGGDAPPERRGRLRQAAGRGPLARGVRGRDRRTRRSSWGCCCWWPPRASRPWSRSRAGCRGRWKGRPRRAPCSTARCRSTWGRSCCCGSARSSIARRCSARLVVALGLATAVFAYLAGSVQTDIKSALSFASLSQVGIIVAEIGLGLPVRRAGPPARPRLPADAPVRAGADAAARLPHAGERHRRAPAAAGGSLGPPGHRRPHAWLYRLALERGYLDAILTELRRRAVRPGLPLVRRAGAPLDRLPRGRGVARVGPGQAPLRNDRRVFMNLLHLPWLELRDRGRAGRLAVRQPAARARTAPTAGAWRSPGSSFACAVLAWLAFYLGIAAEATRPLERRSPASSAGRSSRSTS